ncbi:MAG: hypothetical protein WCL51_16915 [Bacteroidota bacterium]
MLKEKSLYQIESADLIEEIRQAASDSQRNLIVESFLNKFENVTVSSAFIKELWGCSKDFITSSIKYGVIKPINPDSQKYLFNAKDILSMENPKWRRIGK